MRTSRAIYLAFLIVFLASLLLRNVYAVDVEITQDGGYDNTNANTNQQLKDLHPSDSSAYSANGQSFATLNDGNTYKLKSVIFSMNKVGLPTGNGYARIYAHSGTFGSSSLPTGTSLAESDALDVSTLTATMTDITFTFSGENQISLTANTYYCIDFENPASGTIDASNYVRVYIDSTSPAHEGNAFDYKSAGWTARAADCAAFYVYGELAGGPSKNLTTSNLGISVSAHNGILVQISQPAHLGIHIDAHTVVMAKILSPASHLSLALASHATTTIASLLSSHLSITLSGHAATLTSFLFPSHLTLSMNMHNALATAILNTQHLELNLQMHNKLAAFIFGSSSTINYIAGSLNVQTASATATPTTLLMVLGLAALAFIIAIVALCIALTKKG